MEDIKHVHPPFTWMWGNGLEVTYTYNHTMTLLENVYALYKQVQLITKSQNELINAMKEFVVWATEHINVEVGNQLQQWLNDGTLEQIINDTLFNQKEDKTDALIKYNANLSKIESTRYNVLWGGADKTGVNPVDSVVTSAINKGYKDIYFPNGVYYFTNLPNLNGVTLSGGDDVTFSVANNWYQSQIINANVEMNIKVVTRDRVMNDSPIINESSTLGQTLRQVSDSMLSYSLQYKDFGLYGYSGTNGIVVDNSKWTKTSNQYGTSYAKLLPSQYGYIMGDLQVGENLQVVTSGVGSFTGSELVGITVANESMNEFHSFYFNTASRTVILGTFAGGVYSESTTLTEKTFKRLKGPSIFWDGNANYKLKVKRISTRSITIYFNDVEVLSYYLPFEPIKGGFSTARNPEGFKFEYPIRWFSEREPINHGLKIKYFGDSLGGGDGSGTSPYKNIENMLKGRMGVQNVSITNHSTGGYKMQQVYATIQLTDLSDTDLIIVEAGANDTGATAGSTLFTAIRDIITYARTQNCRVVFAGVPPQTSYTYTQAGAEFSKSHNQPWTSHLIELGIASLIRPHIDLAYAKNIIGSNSTEPFEWAMWNNDNIHLTNFGGLLLANSIVNAIIELYAPKTHLLGGGH